MIWVPSAVSVALTAATAAAWHPLPQLAGACAVLAAGSWLFTVAVAVNTCGKQWQDGLPPRPEPPRPPGLTKADRAYLEGRRGEMPPQRGERGTR